MAGCDLRSTIDDRHHPASTHSIYIDPKQLAKLQARSGGERLFPLEYSFKEQRTSLERYFNADSRHFNADSRHFNAASRCVRSDLSEANLTGAKLDDVSFHQAVLTKAVFRGAALKMEDGPRAALFRRAKVDGADFSGVQEFDLLRIHEHEAAGK